MAAVRGGGKQRAIVAELAGEVVFVRWLPPDEPDPSQEELDALAESYRLGAADYDPKYRELEPGNGGRPVTCRVTAYAYPGPLAYTYTPEQIMAMAGVNDDGSVGAMPSQPDSAEDVRIVSRRRIPRVGGR